MIYNFYCILNVINGKKYIGMTKRKVCVRYKEHIRCALNEHDIKNDYVMPLLNAIRKYGVCSFVVDIIDSVECPTFDVAEQLEGKIIEEVGSLCYGYNLNYRNISNRIYAYNVKENIYRNNTGVNNPFYNKKHTDKARKMISDKSKKRLSDPTKNPMYGKFHKDDTKEKIKKSKIKNANPFWGDGKYYMFLTDAAIECGVTKQAIKYRITSSNWPGWYYE